MAAAAGILASGSDFADNVELPTTLQNAGTASGSATGDEHEDRSLLKVAASESGSLADSQHGADGSADDRQTAASRIRSGSSIRLQESASKAKAQAFGMALVLLSTFAFSSMSLMVNILGSRVPSLQTTALRFVLQGLFTVMLIAGRGAWKGESGSLRIVKTWLGDRTKWWMLFRRGAWGIGGMSTYFYALSQIGLADATALVFTNVPLTAILARFILKEPYSVWDAGTGVACMVGVLLIAQPPALFGADPSIQVKTIPWYTVIIILLGSVCSAMAYITIRSIGSGIDPLVVVLWFSIVGSICTPLLAVITQTQVFIDLNSLSASELWLELAIGFTGFIGQVLLNRGIALSPAGPATVMRYCDVVFALIFQATLLHDPPSPLKLCGCFLILSCSIAVYMKQRKKGKEQKQHSGIVSGTSAGNATSSSSFGAVFATSSPSGAATNSSQSASAPAAVSTTAGLGGTDTTTTAVVVNVGHPSTAALNAAPVAVKPDR